MIEVEPHLIGRLRTASTVIALAVAVIAVASLTGWVLNVDALKSVAPGLATMKANTAISLLACAAALAARGKWQRGRGARIADVLAVIAIIPPALTLIEWAGRVDFHIDQLLFTDTSNPLHGHAGRMSIATAACLVSIGLATLVLDWLTRLSQTLALLCLVAALLGLLGYAYGVPYYAFAYSSMAIHTMASLILLPVALLMIRPRRCLHQLLISRSLGGRMARRVLPATIVVPLVVGWLRLKGEEHGLYGMRFGLALFALSNIIILAAIVWWNAMMLDRTLLQRRRAERDRDDLLIREQHARAHAEKALAARDQLLSVVSHELRTPLTPVLLMAASIEHRAQLPQDVQEDIRMIREQIELEAHLIDALLDLTSLQQGKITIKRDLVSLNDVAGKALSLFGRLAESHNVKLITELAEECPKVRGDQSRLQQAAANLFSNAIKFTPAGGSISLRTFRNGDRACLEIRDSGVGISPEAVGRLFGPFEQADRSTNRRFGGLGIGLAISQRLIELHDGRLIATSDGQDQGSTFTISLPAAETAPPKVPEAAPRSILIVDDNRMTVKALQRILESHGHRIAVAVAGRQAIETVLGGQFDLIISDIGLPDLSGWEMMRQLRQQLETRGRRAVRGIAISGFVDNDDRQKSLECGFVAHLAKPIDVTQLIETVNATLDGGLPASAGSQMTAR